MHYLLIESVSPYVQIRPRLVDRPWLDWSPGQEWRRSELIYLDLEKQATGHTIHSGRTRGRIMHIKGTLCENFTRKMITYAKLCPICKIIAHTPGKGRMWENPWRKGRPKLPHTPCTQRGWSVHQSQRRSLVRLTEDLSKDSKWRGEMAALYARSQGRSGVGWQRLPHTKSTTTPKFPGKGLCNPYSGHYSDLKYELSYLIY